MRRAVRYKVPANDRLFSLHLYPDGTVPVVADGCATMNSVRKNANTIQAEM